MTNWQGQTWLFNHLSISIWLSNRTFIIFPVLHAIYFPNYVNFIYWLSEEIALRFFFLGVVES